MKALVLAGGSPQIELINQLKERGVYTILADWNEEPVAKKYCDKYYRESTMDFEKIKQIAVAEKVDFLITVCTDQALNTIAKVSEELGLPCYIDYQTALNVTNKSYMKKVFVENGVPTSKHVITGEYKEGLDEGMEYPLIVKPVDCNSSKGVKKVQNREELKTFVEIAAKLSRTKTAIVEEFVQGDELSADVYVENGVAKLMCVSRLDKIKNNNKFIIMRGRCAPLDDELFYKIQDVAQKIADAFGLKNNPMLIQMMERNGKLYVLEFSARTGGGQKFILIKQVAGFDVVKAVIDLTMGEFPHCEPKRPTDKFVYNEFAYCKPGVLEKVEGLEELVQNGIIQNYQIYKTKGMEFGEIESSGDRAFGVAIHGKNIDEIREKHFIVNKTVKVFDSNGQDIMCHEIFDQGY